MPARRRRCPICGQLHNVEDLRKFKQGGGLVCTDCIASHDEWIECDECHLVEQRYNLFDNDGTERIDITRIGEKNVCDSCRERLYIQCEGCGNWIRKEEILEVADCLVCEECSRDNFAECDICHSRVFAPSLRNVNHGEQRICQRCATGYTECRDCHTLISQEHRRIAIAPYGNQVTICDRCAENYIECPDCHRLMRENEARRDDEDDILVCNNCYERSGESVIHSYHQGEEYVKRMAGNDNVNEDVFFGLELEVGGERRYARKFLRLFEPQTIQLMNDSSVRGFEIVTMPMTYNFLMKKFIPQLKRGLQFLIEKNFKGHNAGGLHIHVSEEAITKCQAAQLGEILYGNSNDRLTWTKIAQRRPENLHWCSLTGSRKFYEITDDTAEKPNVSMNRHTALNHDSNRTHTYEFRIFNSSLRIDRILKNIECVVALLDYTSNYRDKDRPVCHTTAFLNYVTSRRIFYPNLCNFLEEKHIVEQHNQGCFSDEFDNENEQEVA